MARHNIKWGITPHRAKTTKAREIIQKWWRWIGHVLCMDNNRICKTALMWQPEGKHKVW